MKHKDKDWLYQKYIVENKTGAQIAREIGSSRKVLCDWIKKFSLIKAKPYYTNKKYLYTKYIKENLSTRDIANLFNISDTQIQYHLKKFGIKKNKNLIQNSREKTLLRKTGYSTPIANPKNLIKRRETMKDRYGVESVYEMRTKEDYKDIHEKRKITCMDKYGVENPSQNIKIQDKISKSVSISSIKMWKENKQSILEKVNKTKKENNSFHISKPELKILHWLQETFGKSNIVHQYKSEDYPFNCDFYIKSINLYVEYQGSWTHHGETNKPYNKNKPPLTWIRKSKKNQFYKNALKTYTVSDPNKRVFAKKNKLKYLELWPVDYQLGENHILKLVCKYH